MPVRTHRLGSYAAGPSYASPDRATTGDDGQLALMGEAITAARSGN